jgi:hypothetical protein
MTKASLNLDTALGSFVFVAACEHRPGEVSLDLKTFEPRLSLPQGMSVLACRAVVLRVSTHVEVAALRWSCESPPNVPGSPCSGQYLDAQEWQAGDRLVVVGTEDEEALANRLGFLQLDPNASLARYSPQKLEMTIPRIPASAAFGLHFILAENTSPEPEDASAWFAVDIPHKDVAAADAA